MSLSALLHRWEGVAYRGLPATAQDVLDFRYAGLSATNRWNVQGERTVYLGTDIGVVQSEQGRYFRDERPESLTGQLTERVLWRLRLQLADVLDVRDPALWQAISLPDAPGSFLDRAVARSTAAYLRATTRACALLVPSVCYLDDLGRGNLVLFLDRLPPTRAPTPPRCAGRGRCGWICASRDRPNQLP